MIITHKLKMDLTQNGAPPRIPMVQGDTFSRRLVIHLFEEKRPWRIPAGATLIRYRKANGECGIYDTLPDGSSAVSVSGNCISILVAPEALTQPGTAALMVSMLSEGRQLTTFTVELQVQPVYGCTETDVQSTSWIAKLLPAPDQAAVGQYFAVAAINEHGQILALKAVDAPVGNPEEIQAAVDAYLDGYEFPTDAISIHHQWDGTILTVSSASGTSSADLKGEKGDPGADGMTPHIGSNGNWWIGTADTGVCADGSASITVDSMISDSSSNPVQNKIIAAELNTIVNVLESMTVDSNLNETSEKPVQNKVVAAEIRMVREALEGMVVDSELSETSTNPVQNKAVTAMFATWENALGSAIMPRLMPEVSAADKGKILQVDENGAWAAVTMAQWSGGEY